MNNDTQMQLFATPSGELTANRYSSHEIELFASRCQQFTQRLNQLPDEKNIDLTPDKKAHTMLISSIEMLLDEHFFGHWETKNFKYSVVANEIVGSIDLVVLNPSSMQHITRTGAAAIQIMVDAAPEEIKNDRVKRNEWALNLANKKPNALDMGFPKLKAECVKNAAISLGKLFGRDINRVKNDTYNPAGLKTFTVEDVKAAFEIVKQDLPAADKQNIERVIKKEEFQSYVSAINHMRKFVKKQEDAKQ